MIGDELRVEQGEAAGAQPGHKRDQREFRRVARAAEHAFTEERAAERDAVEAADKVVVRPDLDRAGVPGTVEIDIERADLRIYPRLRPVGAGVDHGVEGGVDADLERAGAEGARETPRDAQIIEGQDSAPVRVEPEDAGRVGRFRHRKNAGRVGPQQKIGGDGRAFIPHAAGQSCRSSQRSSQWMS